MAGLQQQGFDSGRSSCSVDFLFGLSQHTNQGKEGGGERRRGLPVALQGSPVARAGQVCVDKLLTGSGQRVPPGASELHTSAPNHTSTCASCGLIHIHCGGHQHVDQLRVTYIFTGQILFALGSMIKHPCGCSGQTTSQPQIIRSAMDANLTRLQVLMYQYKVPLTTVVSLDGSVHSPMWAFPGVA